MPSNRIRPIAICVFRKDDRILVPEGYDSTKEQPFYYRPLGGGIEFGEYAGEAVRREIREEIGAEVVNLEYLGVLENIFTLEGEIGHEIVFVYLAEFRDGAMYETSSIYGKDDTKDGSIQSLEALWKPITEFQSGQARLVPEGLLELLIKHRNTTALERS